jgi:DNA polymerase/3'-5' exonuclease PolX
MSLNNSFINVLDNLSAMMQKKGEIFRAKAYKKAQESITSCKKNITCIEDVNGLPGIGPSIIQKLKEYMDSGNLKILEDEKIKPENTLTDVYGIGPKKAAELVKMGITNISQLREKQNEVLNKSQIIGLKYYEDILERIPRSEIDKYSDAFALYLHKTTMNYEIVGSYRRGSSDSGDIDVILTSEKSNDFKEFIDFLVKSGIIIEILSKGPCKCLVIARLPGYKYARRIDFLFTNKEEYPFSILYFTGSKSFNTGMRSRALEFGYTLNEHGLYKMENGVKGKKIHKLFKDEKDIFDELQMNYKEPHERIISLSV